MRDNDKMNKNEIELIIKKIEMLIELKKYNEAKEIGKNFEDDASVQFQMIKIARKQEDYIEAEKIAKKFEKDPLIQSQMIKCEFARNNFENAKKIGENFQDDGLIQSQMVKIAIIEKEYEKAKKIGDKFKESSVIQSQMITIAIKEKEYEKAKDIGKSFKDSIRIQSQMITIAIIEKNYKKAIEISEKYKDNDVIQRQIKNIPLYKKLLGKQNVLNEIRTKLYFNEINENEIKQNTELSDDIKTMILIAYYEKKENKTQVQILCKDLKDKGEYLKETNIILERVNSKKKKIFDFAFYDNILNWKFDEELLQKYQEKIKKEMKEKAKEDRTIRKNNAHISKTTKKPKPQPNYVLAYRQSLPQENAKKNNSAKITNAKKFKKEELKKENKSYIQDIKKVTDLINKSKIETYPLMQSEDKETKENAIKKWDKIEIFMEDLKEAITNLNNSNPKIKTESEEKLKIISARYKKISSKELEKEER